MKEPTKRVAVWTDCQYCLGHGRRPTADMAAWEGRRQKYWSEAFPIGKAEELAGPKPKERTEPCRLCDGEGGAYRRISLQAFQDLLREEAV